MRNNRRVLSKPERRNLIIKWALYLLLLILIFVYSTTQYTHSSIPKPLLFLPLALCISSQESEMPSAASGLVCGFFMDAACNKLFGFNALILMTLCLFTCLLFLYLLRQNIINVLMLSAGAVLIQGSLDFLFFYVIWRYEDLGFLFVRHFLPQMGLTLLMTLPMYFLVRWIGLRFGPVEEHFIEEKSEDIVRE